VVPSGLTLKAIGEGVVSTVPSALDIADAVRLSLAIRHALQDCLYLALAMRLDAELAIADSTFAARAGTAHHAVRLLAQGIRE
jgi:predicted nucleic acid-binding protein